MVTLLIYISYTTLENKDKLLIILSKKKSNKWKHGNNI